MTRNLPYGVVTAPPLWTMDAEHSVDHVARVRHAHGIAKAVADLVTKHPVPYFADPVTASARTLERLAASKGMTTRLHVGLDGCTLEGRVDGQRRGFTASWSRGRAQTALWFEPDWQWGFVHDERPAAGATVPRTVKGKTVRVADPKRIPYGLDRDHLAQIAGPNGVVVGFAELTARVKALPDG